MSDEPLADIRIGTLYRPGMPRVPGIQAARNLFRTRRLVILVHGFNSSPEGSARSYDIFREKLRYVAPKLDDDVKTMTWPGRALYWNAVVRASGDSAQVLADYLERAGSRRPEDLIFVCHSLGCRLVLEALDRLPQAQKATLLPKTRLFLMAAAVPTRMVAPAEPLRSTVNACRQTNIFYSRMDEVLGTVFTFGQLRDTGGFTEAIGWSGNPANLWGKRRFHMAGYQHGTYWKSEEIAYRVALSLRAAENRPLTRQIMKAKAHAGRALPARRLDLHTLPKR